MTNDDGQREGDVEAMAANRNLTRHPLAIAWDDWLASDEGRHCVQPNNALARPSLYLENRLHRAFDAGTKAAASPPAREAAWQGTVDALTKISTGRHSDTCSRELVASIPCDCHVSVARAALADAGKGRE